MYNDTDWSKHYDPIPFYYWRKASNGLRHFLNPGIKIQCIFIDIILF